MGYVPKGNNQIIKSEEFEIEEVQIHNEFMYEYMMNMMKKAIENHRPFSFPASPHHRIDFVPVNTGYVMYYTFIKTKGTKPPNKVIPEKTEKREPQKKTKTVEVEQSEDVVM